MAGVRLVLLAGWVGLGGMQAQTFVLRGQVLDPEGRPLPHTIVRLPESGFQTVSTAEGRFTLSFTGPQRVRIELRHLGYRTHIDSVELEAPETQRSFTLYPQEVRLPGVIITEEGRDPAEILIRKAIAAKARNRACLPAFRVETYTLFSVRLGEASWALRRLLPDTLKPGDIFWMSEALSQLYFSAPDRYREEIVRSRIVGTRQYSFLGSWIFQGFDPYGERLSLQELTETPFILPLARDAPLYYRYRLVGSYWDEEQLFYKVAVEPKSRTSPCVTGYLVLADESYALVGLEWGIWGPRPIRYTDSIAVRFTYVPVGECYVPGELNFQAKFRVAAGVGELSFSGEGYASYKRYQVLIAQNSAQPASPSRRVKSKSAPTVSEERPPRARVAVETLRVGRIDWKEPLWIAPEAATAQATFWDSVRQAPLDSAQQRYILYQDSLAAQRDTQARLVKESGFTFGQRGVGWRRMRRQGERERQWGISLAWPGYTGVEGWFLPFKLAYSMQRGASNWEAEVLARYGFGWGRLAPVGRLTWTTDRYPLWRASLSGGVEIREPTDFPLVPVLWNALYRIARADPPWQGYARPFVQGELSFQLHRSLRLALRSAWDERAATPTRESTYSTLRAGVGLAWRPGTRAFTTPRRTVLLPPEKVFRWNLTAAMEAVRLPTNWLFTASVGPTAALSISPLGLLELHLGASWQSASTSLWAEQLYPSTVPLLLHRYYTDLVRWPLYQTTGRVMGQGALSWLPKGALLRSLPLLRRTPWQENLTLRALYTAAGAWHVEGSFYLTDIRLRRVSFGLPLGLGLHTGIVGAGRGVGFTVGLGELRSRAVYSRPALP